MKLIALLLVTAMLPAAVLARTAQSGEDEQPLGELTAQSLPEQRAAVIAAFEPGERFAELDQPGRNRVIEALDRMQERIAAAGSIEALDPDQEVELFNDQELVNEILTEAHRDSRITCKRYRTVNSRLKNGECHTAAEWERRRERARKLVDMNKRAVVCPGGCE